MSIKVRQFFKKSFFAYSSLDNISFSMFNISFLAFRKMDFLHFPRGYNDVHESPAIKQIHHGNNFSIFTRFML
jgi:hypothetical protein